MVVAFTQRKKCGILALGHSKVTNRRAAQMIRRGLKGGFRDKEREQGRPK